MPFPCNQMIGILFYMCYSISNIHIRRTYEAAVFFLLLLALAIIVVVCGRTIRGKQAGGRQARSKPGFYRRSFLQHGPRI